MTRREFLSLLGGAAAWPFAARAQQPDRMRRIGALIGFAESDPEQRARTAAFLDRLSELGLDGGPEPRHRLSPHRRRDGTGSLLRQGGWRFLPISFLRRRIRRWQHCVG
jgi:hypothetical protein